MYLVSNESNRTCRRSSDLTKVDGRTPDKSVSDKLRLTKVSGAKNTKSPSEGECSDKKRVELTCFL